MIVLEDLPYQKREQVLNSCLSTSDIYKNGVSQISFLLTILLFIVQFKSDLTTRNWC